LFVLAIASVAAAELTYLATFNGAQSTTVDWKEVNDPVMGGKSVGTFAVDQTNKKGVFNGTCALIPALNAPGFCNVQSQPMMFKKFPDVSQYLDGSFMIRVRSSTPEFKGFKLGWGAPGVPKSSSFSRASGSFKAPFTVTGTDWQVIAVNISSFSWDWSPFTGECDTKDPTGQQHHCCTAEQSEYCPTAKFLSTIDNLAMWAEGFEGNFHLEVEWIGIGSEETPQAVCDANEYCCPDAKACLAPTGLACPNTGDKCPVNTICCPLTKLCVKVGNPCKTPCAVTEYCCPDVLHCLTPVNPGFLCKTNSDCNSGNVCCPLTKVCVAVGNACTPP